MKVSIFLVSLCLLLVLTEAKYFAKRDVQDEGAAEVQADNNTMSDANGANVDVAPAAETKSDDNKLTTEMPQDAPASVSTEMPSSEASSESTGAEQPSPAEQASSDQAGSSGSPSSELPSQNEEPTAQSSSETPVSVTGMADKAEEVKPGTEYSVEVSSIVVIETKPVETPTAKEPETPAESAKENETPVKEAETPTKEAETPTKEAETPVKEAQTPTKEAQTPTKEAQTPTKEAETPVKEAQTPTKEGENSSKKEPEQQPTNTNSTDTNSAISEPVAAGSTKKNGGNSGVGFVASIVLVALCLCLTTNQ